MKPPVHLVVILGLKNKYYYYLLCWYRHTDEFYKQVMGDLVAVVRIVNFVSCAGYVFKNEKKK